MRAPASDLLALVSLTLFLAGLAVWLAIFRAMGVL